MHKQLEMGSKLKYEKKNRKPTKTSKKKKKQTKRKFRQTPVANSVKIFQRKTKQYHKKIQFHIKSIGVKEIKTKNHKN
jgi:hypothetical protein